MLDPSLHWVFSRAQVAWFPVTAIPHSHCYNRREGGAQGTGSPILGNCNSPLPLLAQERRRCPGHLFRLTVRRIHPVTLFLGDNFSVGWSAGSPERLCSHCPQERTVPSSSDATLPRRPYLSLPASVSCLESEAAES